MIIPEYTGVEKKESETSRPEYAEIIIPTGWCWLLNGHKLDAVGLIKSESVIVDRYNTPI